MITNVETISNIMDFCTLKDQDIFNIGNVQINFHHGNDDFPLPEFRISNDKEQFFIDSILDWQQYLIEAGYAKNTVPQDRKWIRKYANVSVVDYKIIVTAQSWQCEIGTTCQIEEWHPIHKFLVPSNIIFKDSICKKWKEHWIVIIQELKGNSLKWQIESVNQLEQMEN